MSTWARTSPWIKGLMRVGLLGFVTLAVLLGLSMSEFSSAPRNEVIPFVHVLIDRSNLGADCKAVGDVNGDGFVDVIVADNSGTPLMWYEYPDWTRHVIDNRSTFTTDMQVGDIDRDGDLDIILSDYGGSQDVVWYENPRVGGGTWTYAIIGSNRGHDLEVGDVDGDGRLDVVARGAGETALFLQNDHTSWRKIVINDLSGEGTALGDLDGDGDLDVAQDGYWLEAPDDKVSGRWLRHDIAIGWPNRVAVTIEDVNADGRLDLILAPSESSGGRLSWYESPLDPKTDVWIEHVIDSDVDFIHTFKTADMDNDGDLDVVTAEMQQSKRKRVTVYRNGGNSLTWEAQVVGRTGSHNIRVADIGNDGDVDIIGGNYSDYSPLELWENRSNDKLPLDEWTYILLDDNRDKKYFGLAVGDLTGDTYGDIVSGRYFYRNPGGNMKAAWPRTAFPNAVDAMLIVDVDGDNFGDVIAERLPSVFWLEAKDTQGSSWNITQIATLQETGHGNGQGYALAELVGGGRPEIILAGGDGIYYLEIPGDPSMKDWPSTQITSEATDEGIGVGDVDGDGDIDICASVGSSGTAVAWWANPGKGSGGWTKYQVGTTANRADRVAMADINADGLLDVVVTEETRLADASIYWFEQSPDSEGRRWVRHTVATQYTTNSMDLADIDKDGDIDIITGEHRGTKKVQVWENINKGSSWVENIISRGKESHLGARAADLDGDGDLEIISIAWDQYRNLYLWRNDAIL